MTTLPITLITLRNISHSKNNNMRHIVLLAFVMMPALVIAQPAGVAPLNATHAAAAQLVGDVHTVETTTWQVDYSRHTIAKGAQTAHTISTYSRDGLIEQTSTFDTDNQLDTKTIYQYDDKRQLRVSTTYDAKGNRTLQTLYAYTADGCLARMRFTDADAVTISTTEVGTANNWAQTSEQFNDGEKIVSTYTYDNKTRLTTIATDDSHTSTTTRITMGLDALPTRATFSTSDGRRQTMTYQHEVDERGNWTREITSIDDTPTTLSVRTVGYY